MSREYALTFGVQYGREPHPSGLSVYPHGYVVIEAESEADARDIAFTHYGRAWSGLYDMVWDFADRGEHFPAGEFRRLTAHTPVEQPTPGIS